MHLPFVGACRTSKLLDMVLREPYSEVSCCHGTLVIPETLEPLARAGPGLVDARRHRGPAVGRAVLAAGAGRRDWRDSPWAARSNYAALGSWKAGIPETADPKKLLRNPGAAGPGLVDARRHRGPAVGRAVLAAGAGRRDRHDSPGRPGRRRHLPRPGARRAPGRAPAQVGRAAPHAAGGARARAAGGPRAWVALHLRSFQTLTKPLT